MAHSSSVNLEIDAAPEEIFPWLIEPEKRLRWIEGLVEITPDGDAPFEVGARWVEIHDVNGREYEFEFEVKAYDPPRRMRCIAHARPQFDTEITYIVESGLAAHSVTIEHTTRFRGWLQRFLGSVMAKGLSRKLDRDLQRPKAAIEGG